MLYICRIILIFYFMYTRFLFPHRFKKVGWILLLIGIAGGLLFTIFENDFPKMHLKVFAIYNSGFPFDNLKNRWFTFMENNPWDEIISIMLVIGSIFVACSKEKTEDEFIARIRFESLLWATYINYFLLLFCILFIYGTVFFTVMIYSLFTLLIIFTLRFKYLLYKSSRSMKTEDMLDKT
jgi:hypothetical protein